MVKKASYIFSAYSFIVTHSLEELLYVGYENKKGNQIPSFDETTLIDLCEESRKILEKESNVLQLEGDFIIVGDIHGSFHDLLRIFNFILNNKMPKVLFLGDYVDRGEFSLECITLLFALKVMYPDSVYLLRGNHEFDSVCSLYGFKNEICIDNFDRYDKYFMNHNCYKYTESLYDAFIKAFAYLPIAAVINGTTFCIHGGISLKLNFINDINKSIQRPINSFEENKLLTDLVWSDPTSCSSCSANPRGHGCLFNQEIVNDFIMNNSIRRIIRAHQCVSSGCKLNFDGKCITIFSVSSYSNYSDNNSGILQLSQKDDTINLTSFLPLCHLQKNDAFFFKVQLPNKKENKDNKALISLQYPIIPIRTNALSIPSNAISYPIKFRRRISLKDSNAFVIQPIKQKLKNNLNIQMKSNCNE